MLHYNGPERRLNRDLRALLDRLLAINERMREQLRIMEKYNNSLRSSTARAEETFDEVVRELVEAGRSSHESE